MNKRLNVESDALAVAVYVAAMRKEERARAEAKYEKRIDYLVGANNELARALERCESAAMIGVAVEKKREEKKSGVRDGELG